MLNAVIREDSGMQVILMCNIRRKTMKGRKETPYGSVQINQSVIAQYAGSVAVECFGIVGMASVNMREGLVKLLRRDKLSNGIEVIITENNALIINFHVIIAYGVNIATVADNLIHNVRYKVREFCDMDVEKINVFVEGVRSIDD